MSYVSHATQQRLQNLVEKISETAQQKNFSYKVTHWLPKEAALAVDSWSVVLGSLFLHQTWGWHTGFECFMELRFGDEATSLAHGGLRLCVPWLGSRMGLHEGARQGSSLGWVWDGGDLPHFGARGASSGFTLAPADLQGSGPRLLP